MGWLYSSGWPTASAMRDHLREELTKSGCTIKKDALTSYGRRYYAAVVNPKLDSGKAHIFVALINSYMESGARWFGYKDMDEFCGPCEVDCPLSVLDAADPLGDDPTVWGYKTAAEGGFKYATDWRAAVRKYWADKAAARTAAKGLKYGDYVWLTKGRRTMNPFRIVEVGSKIRGVAADDKQVYRIPKTWIERVEPVVGSYRV